MKIQIATQWNCHIINLGASPVGEEESGLDVDR